VPEDSRWRSKELYDLTSQHWRDKEKELKEENERLKGQGLVPNDTSKSHLFEIILALLWLVLAAAGTMLWSDIRRIDARQDRFDQTQQNRGERMTANEACCAECRRDIEGLKRTDSWFQEYLFGRPSRQPEPYERRR
jgi:hypothetical protein